MNALQKLLRFALDLAFPRRAVCAGCGSQAGCDEDWLCADCAERLAGGRTGGRALPGRFPIARRAHAHPYRGPVAEREASGPAAPRRATIDRRRGADRDMDKALPWGRGCRLPLRTME